MHWLSLLFCFDCSLSEILKGIRFQDYKISKLLSCVIYLGDHESCQGHFSQRYVRLGEISCLILTFSIHAGRRNGNDEISFLILTFSIHSGRRNGEISFSSLISLSLKIYTLLDIFPVLKYIHHQNKASLENLMKRIRLT